jgi:Integrase core domain
MPTRKRNFSQYNFDTGVFLRVIACHVAASTKENRAKNWNIKHVRNCGVSKGHGKTNNRIERMNRPLRERVKVQRGWKSFESQIAEGQRIHYNFVKPHQALEGQTPAQRAGIAIENNWLELLEQRSISESETRQTQFSL